MGQVKTGMRNNNTNMKRNSGLFSVKSDKNMLTRLAFKYRNLAFFQNEKPQCLTQPFNKTVTLVISKLVVTNWTMKARRKIHH